MLVSPTIVFSQIVDMQPIDIACTDVDGDGYGWNGSNSCPPFIAAHTAQVARLIPTDEQVELFAQEVDVSGDLMIVEANDAFNINNGYYQASAYILRRGADGEKVIRGRVSFVKFKSLNFTKLTRPLHSKV